MLGRSERFNSVVSLIMDQCGDGALRDKLVLHSYKIGMPDVKLALGKGLHQKISNESTMCNHNHVTVPALPRLFISQFG